MRQLTFVGPGRVEWCEVPAPAVRDDHDAIVRPVAATTCDLDNVIIAGRTPLQPPMNIGHECIAEVLDTGRGVTHIGAGDLVVVPWHIACGRCGRCERRLFAHCEAVPPLAMYGADVGGRWGGLFDDVVRVPWADAMLVPVPAGVGLVEAVSASDNLSLAWRLVAPHLTRTPAARVLIVNAGSIGLYAADMALALGASRVLFVDRSAERRRLAASWGADVAADHEPGGRGFDLAVESTGNTDRLGGALLSLEPEGVCESAGNHFRPAPLPLLQMYFNGVTLRVARDNVRDNIEPALELLAGGRLHTRDVVTGLHDWEDLPTVLPQATTKPVFVRAGVRS